MQPTAHVDVQQALRGLEQLAKEQFPFAALTGLNRTAEEGLAVMRDRIRRDFIVREPRFTLPPTQLPKEWRATKHALNATMGLSEAKPSRDSIGARRAAILSKFEEGGFKRAENPDYPIAIPTKVLRPTPEARIPMAMYPSQLGLAPRRDVSGAMVGGKRRGAVRSLDGKLVKSARARARMGLVGKGGTFTMLDTQGKPLGVFQRLGSGKRDYRMLWAFRQRIPIPARLNMAATARAVVAQRLEINLAGALELALRTAR